MRKSLNREKEKQNILSGNTSRLLLNSLLACFLSQKKEIRFRHSYKRTNPGSAPDVTLTKEKSVLTKIKNLFEGKNKQTQYYSLLGYRIDLYFHDYKLAIEIDENGHSNRSIDFEIKKQKAIEQISGRKFIRIDPNKEDFDIFKAINEIFMHIKQSSNWLTKKTLIDKYSMRLLGLEFKSDNAINLKVIKYIVKKYCPIMNKVGWFYFI